MAVTWIIGASGQLGFYLRERLGAAGRGFGHDDLELADIENLPARLFSLAEDSPPSAVINASAYNHVDRAETEREACWTLNVKAPAVLAEWCRSAHVPFLHFSTDFVYSGEGDGIWRESDATAPVNYYGESKLAGERAVLEAHGSAGIVRTSWVYSHRRENFVLAILKRARSGQPMKVVADQVGSPTYADALAMNALQLLGHPDFGRAEGRIWHLADHGHVSRHEFACEILAQAARFEPQFASVPVEPVRTSDYVLPARRPLNTRLSLARAAQFGIVAGDWRQNLRHCLERHYASR